MHHEFTLHLLVTTDQDAEQLRAEVQAACEANDALEARLTHHRTLTQAEYDEIVADMQGRDGHDQGGPDA